MTPRISGVVASGVEQDQGHFTVVVDLRQPRRHPVVELLDVRKEAQPSIFRRLTANELLQRGLVFGTDRPQRQHPAVARPDRLFELGRVRADRQTRVRRLVGRCHPDARGNRQHALRVGQQRVDVDLDDLCYLSHQLRELDERFGDLVEVGGRAVAIALQQGMDARFRRSAGGRG